MKCEVCSELLEEYLDGELEADDREQVGAHLIACVECSESLAALTAEEELFARYDREIEVPPFLWTRIAANTVSNNRQKTGWRGLLAEMFVTPSAVVAGAIVLFALVIALGFIFGSSEIARVAKGTDPRPVRNPESSPPRINNNPLPVKPEDDVKPKFIASKPRQKMQVRSTVNHDSIDQSDVLSSDLAYLDMDEQDTAKHIEQSKLLLRSIKNVQISDTDDEIDVTYDKALSRRLLNENVVLRRDAEMKAKFPTKTLLADLEPFLIDIANLPDRARPQDVREIKERVQKTEIVAALLDYQDRGTNNR